MVEAPVVLREPAARPAALPAASDAEVEREQRHHRNILALAGGQLITWSFVLAWTFIVPRRLGASQWGMLVTGSAVAGILGTLMGLGTRNFLVREMVRTSGTRSELLATASVVRLALIPPGFAALVLYVRLAGYETTEEVVIFIAAAGMFLALLSEPLEALFQAAERMEFLAAGDISDKVVQSAGAIALVLLGFGVYAVATWAVVVAVLVLGLELLWIRRFVRPALRTDWGQVRSMLSGAIPYWTMGLFLTFYVWIDSAMLGLMAPSEVVGWYGVPTRLFGTMLFAATILSTAWLPRLVAAHEGGRDQLREVARFPLERAMVLSFPVALGGAVVSAPLIRTLYGPDFEGAIPAMAILAVCVLPLYVNIMANQVLVASGRQVVWTRLMIAASLVNPLLNLVAIEVCQQRYGNGAIGAAASLLATELLIALVSLFVILGGVLTASSWFRIARALLAALPMAAVVYLASGLGLAAQVAIGVVSFGTLALALRVPTIEDQREALQLLGRLRSRGRR